MRSCGRGEGEEMSVSDGDLGLIRFIQFRKRYLKAIERALKKDDHHKSYEGQMLVEVYWPDYFHDNEMLPSEVVLKIDCYGCTSHFGWS